MVSEQEIRDRIAKVTHDSRHVLDCGPATIEVNAPRALMQLMSLAALDALYWTLGETRPRFECDDFRKRNH